MKAVIQRVASASVVVGGATVGAIERGLCVLAAVETGDTTADLKWAAGKLANLRIFPDAEGKMNRSPLDLLEAGEEVGVLMVSNFTVAGRIAKGRRPSFDAAMRPPEAEARFDELVALVREHGLPVATGAFGAHMTVSIINDGPVTLTLDTTTR